MKRWRIRSSKTLFERPWLTIRLQHVVLPTGAEIEEFHLIEGRPWVGILALTQSGDVLVVDQYRHGLGEVSRELPAGVIDEGETALEAAKRELLEETGYQAATWRDLAAVAPEPHRGTTRAHFFFAEGAERVAEPNLDECENLEVCVLPTSELLASVERGDIVHGVHTGPILLAFRRGWLKV